MRLISGLADLLVLAPASVALIAILARMGAIGEAVAYAKALLICLIATFAMKFSFAACGVGEGVRSPSGHVAFAATFYGCLAMLLAARRSALARGFVAAAVAGFVVLVAVSRVALHAHSRLETIVGAAVGLAALAVFAVNRPKHAPSDAPLSAGSTLAPLALVFLVLALPLANHWSAEPWIDALAEDFGALTHLCR